MPSQFASEVKVRMSREFIEKFIVRDELGNRLHWEWGKMDDEGFYAPTISVDYTDNIVERVSKGD